MKLNATVPTAWRTIIPRTSRKLTSITGTLCLLGALAVLEPVSQTAAQTGDPQYGLVGLGPNLFGSYAFRFTGTVFLPAPYDHFNSPFVRSGRLFADGNGNLSATVVANYAGFVSRDSFTGTYKVNSDGTFTCTIPNLTLPPLAGVPNVFSFEGVLADGGKTALVVLSAISIAGQPQANIGSVIYGDFVRQ